MAKKAAGLARPPRISTSEPQVRGTPSPRVWQQRLEGAVRLGRFPSRAHVLLTVAREPGLLLPARVFMTAPVTRGGVRAA